MEEEKWWAGEDRAPTLRPLLVRGQGNEICRKPKGIRKFRETLSHGCTANMICASLRSGGRRLAFRTAMENHIGAMPRTPFPASRDFAPVGSMSLDFQVASLSYKSSSFATSRGNEKIGGTGYCVTYDTDSQSRNVLASPLGEEGHEVAKGCTRVRMIMILDVDVTAAGGIIKLIALRAIPQPSGQRPVKLKNPPAHRAGQS